MMVAYLSRLLQWKVYRMPFLFLAHHITLNTQIMPRNAYTQWKWELVHLPLPLWLSTLSVSYTQAESDMFRLRKFSRGIT